MTLEDEATRLLEESVEAEGKILRDIGVINRHRARKINDHEIPFSAVWPSVKPRRIRTDDDVKDD